MIDFPTVFKEVCCGDGVAQNFCMVMLAHVHTLDDLIDRDKALSPSDVAGEDFRFIYTLATNTFFQKHKEVLMPTLLIGGIAWRDSEDWKNRPHPLDKLASQVLKSQYQDIFTLVAFLCGGQTHAMEMARKHRNYNWDRA